LFYKSIPTARVVIGEPLWNQNGTLLKNGYFISNDLKVHIGPLKHHSNKQGLLIIRPENFRPVKEKDRPLELNHGTNSSFLQGTVKQSSFRQGFHYLKVEVDSKYLDVVYHSKDASSMDVGELIRLYYHVNQLTFIQE
jgi:ABC-type Fe3+/spermidine/putrescine transport system ATPase subunit